MHNYFIVILSSAKEKNAIKEDYIILQVDVK